MRKKLSLTDLKVTSFTTTYTRRQREDILAGNVIGQLTDVVIDITDIIKLTEGPDSMARSCLHACATHEYCTCGGCPDDGSR
ncbi:MAG: hypothetical protein QNK37_08425 [Acidobacteriota bacterium]|nr:hypothetical protein [Acidobacteriota bacterium]